MSPFLAAIILAIVKYINRKQRRAGRMCCVISCPYNPGGYKGERQLQVLSLLGRPLLGDQTSCSADTQVRLTSINGRLNPWKRIRARLYTD